MSKPLDLKSVLNQQRKPEIFDERDQDGRIPTKMLGLRIPETDHRALKALAAQQGVSLTYATQQAISEYLHAHS